VVPAISEQGVVPAISGQGVVPAISGQGWFQQEVSIWVGGGPSNELVDRGEGVTPAMS